MVLILKGLYNNLNLQTTAKHKKYYCQLTKECYKWQLLEAKLIYCTANPHIVIYDLIKSNLFN